VRSDVWKEDLEAYLVTNLVEGKSKNTIKQYRFHLTKLLTYLSKDVRDITTEDIFKLIISVLLSHHMTK